MKKGLLLLLIVVGCNSNHAQQNSNEYLNAADQLIKNNNKLMIGGYASVDYNQPFDSDIRSNGKLDVHRLVMLLGYRFSEKTHFISEIEYEHVSELYVEQAYLQHKINNFINLRAGLMLIPMGIVNEYHEPTTFNGVERPFIDNVIAPTTWREIGIGATGTIINTNINYQAYIVNGFNGYDGSAKFNASKGFRSGRQKGAESYISSPNLAARIEYFGLKGINIGLSGYFGKSQSKEYDGIPKNDDDLMASADSSTIGISMIGIDARYSISALQLRGQLYSATLSNTGQYNTYSGLATDEGIGSKMYGYYIEAGYDLFKHSNISNSSLIPFIRYEEWNTQANVENGFIKNDIYNKSAIIAGLGWKITPGTVLKADIEFVNSANSNKSLKKFNAGLGIMF